MESHPNLLERIIGRRIIAVVRFDAPEPARRAVEAIIAAGITTIEITLTTPGALGLIGELASRPELIVGAGSVLAESQARGAFDAGARFYASPIFDEPIMAIAREAGAVAMPGAHTPGEIVRAWRAGADLIKIFPMPAEGARYLAAIRGPLPDIRLAPSGGVSSSTAAAMLRAGAAALNVGTWLTHEQDGSIGSAASIRERGMSLVAAVERAG